MSSQDQQNDKRKGRQQRETIDEEGTDNYSGKIQRKGERQRSVHFEGDVPLVVIEIQMKDKVGVIPIFEFSNPKDLAQQFAKKNSLDEKTCKHVCRYIQDEMSAALSLKQQKPGILKQSQSTAVLIQQPKIVKEDKEQIYYLKQNGDCEEIDQPYPRTQLPIQQTFPTSLTQNQMSKQKDHTLEKAQGGKVKNTDSLGMQKLKDGFEKSYDKDGYQNERNQVKENEKTWEQEKRRGIGNYNQRQEKEQIIKKEQRKGSSYIEDNSSDEEEEEEKEIKRDEKQRIKGSQPNGRNHFESYQDTYGSNFKEEPLNNKGKARTRIDGDQGVKLLEKARIQNQNKNIQNNKDEDDDSDSEQTYQADVNKASSRIYNRQEGERENRNVARNQPDYNQANNQTEDFFPEKIEPKKNNGERRQQINSQIADYDQQYTRNNDHLQQKQKVQVGDYLKQQIRQENAFSHIQINSEGPEIATNQSAPNLQSSFLSPPMKGGTSSQLPSTYISNNYNQLPQTSPFNKLSSPQQQNQQPKQLSTSQSAALLHFPSQFTSQQSQNIPFPQAQYLQSPSHFQQPQYPNYQYQQYLSFPPFQSPQNSQLFNQPPEAQIYQNQQFLDNRLIQNQPFINTQQPGLNLQPTLSPSSSFHGQYINQNQFQQLQQPQLQQLQLSYQHQNNNNNNVFLPASPSKLRPVSKISETNNLNSKLTQGNLTPTRKRIFQDQSNSNRSQPFSMKQQQPARSISPRNANGTQSNNKSCINSMGMGQQVQNNQKNEFQLPVFNQIISQNGIVTNNIQTRQGQDNQLRGLSETAGIPQRAVFYEQSINPAPMMKPQEFERTKEKQLIKESNNNQPNNVDSLQEKVMKSMQTCFELLDDKNAGRIILSESASLVNNLKDASEEMKGELNKLISKASRSKLITSLDFSQFYCLAITDFPELVRYCKETYEVEKSPRFQEIPQRPPSFGAENQDEQTSI